MLAQRRRLRVQLLEGRYLLAGDIWEGRVGASSDDAEQRASGAVILPSSDLELTRDLRDEQTVGLRFVDVNIPAGATIRQAYLQFQADEKGLAPASFLIRGQATGNAATFSNLFSNISDRVATRALVQWFPRPWLITGQAGPDQRTPDLSAVIQEIVNRPDWSDGNAIAFLINGSGRRVGESYDGDADAAPLLHIEYAVNGLPTAFNDTFRTDEDTAVMGDVLARNSGLADTDPDGDPLTVTAVNGMAADVGKQIALPSGALLTLDASGSFDYDPNAGFDSLRSGQTATDTFTYQIDDSKFGGTDLATVTLTVKGVNDAPSILVNTGATVYEGSLDSITPDMLQEGDPDDGGRSLTYTLTRTPANGTLRLNGSAFGPNGTFTQDDIDNHRIRYDHNGSEDLFDSFEFRLFDGGEDDSSPALGTFNITVVPVLELPTLTRFTSPVKTTSEDTKVILTLAELKARGDEATADGTVDAFVVKTVDSGTLKLGRTFATATAWTAGLNDTIDASTHAYWTPPLNSTGIQDAFGLVAVNNAGAESIGTVTVEIAVSSIHDVPTLTRFSSVIDITPEDTEVEVTLAELKIQGDESDANGAVNAFGVKSVMSGTLRIGTSIHTATPWVAGINDIINVVNRAYWTPATNTTDTQNAFGVVAINHVGVESIGSVTAQIFVSSVNDLPTLSRFTNMIDVTAEDTEVELTLAEFKAQGDEASVDGEVIAFGVKTVNTGALRIGTSAVTATPWAAGSNDRIDVVNRAYWTPALNAVGRQDALAVVAIDDLGAESVVSVTAEVLAIAVDDIPTLTDFAGVVDTTTEDTIVEVTLAELKAKGDEDDVDGTVAAFGVKSVMTGTLSIGTSIASATPWIIGFNDTIDATNHAYWKPAANAVGTQNAFALVAVNEMGVESIGSVPAQILVLSVNDLPTLTQFADVIDTTMKDTQVELTLAELKVQGDQSDADGSLNAFRVTSVTTGTLRIGSSAAKASAWAFRTNDTIDATNHAYWTPAVNAIGTQNVFAVVVRNNIGLESFPPVVAQVTVTSGDDDPLPTCGTAGSVCFAVLGDWGEEGPILADVASLVKSWSPDLIITTGDNNYPDGEAKTIDDNIGQYFHEYIHPYHGSYGSGGDTNRFFPSLGNHDWHATDVQPHLDYFTLPGNERYYDFTWGPVHFFAIDSDREEPDGFTSSSTQGQWLQSQLASSTSPWKIVYMHHPPYSSAKHGSSEPRQWPFKEWGASAVLTGHDHTYERIVLDDFPYFVNGLGGRRAIYSFEMPIEGSKVRYNSDHGAMLVRANDTHVIYEFISRTGVVVDSYTVANTGQLPTVTVSTTDSIASEANTDPATLIFNRTGDIDAPLDVNFTLHGKAVNGSDYVLLDGVASFPTGASSVSIEVKPINDEVIEGSESVIVGLRTSSSYNVGTAKNATIEIQDDDVMSVVVSEFRVASSSDDAEERIDGKISLASSDLELTLERGFEQAVGLRFAGVDIPRDAIILNAYLQFHTDEADSEPTSLMVRGQAIDDAPTFTLSSHDISSRMTTNASVRWSPASWLNVGQAGPDQQTPDISSIIQETVSRVGWSNGNSLAIILTGTGQRTAESFNGSKKAAPLLHVEYALANSSKRSAVSPSSAGTASDALLIIPMDLADRARYFTGRIDKTRASVDLDEFVKNHNAMDKRSHQPMMDVDSDTSEGAAVTMLPRLPSEGKSAQREVGRAIDQLLSDGAFLSQLRS